MYLQSVKLQINTASPGEIARAGALLDAIEHLQAAIEALDLAAQE
jgi:hypothetical protein